MKAASNANYLVIFVSFVVALILEVLPLRASLLSFRPEFVYMVLIYWTIYAPLRVGVIFAWCLGMLLDVMHGSWLGLHSVAMISMVVFVNFFARRIRMFGLGKQVILIASLILMANSFYFLLQFTKWNSLSFIELFMPALISAALWPALVFCLSKVTQGIAQFEYL